MDALIIQLASNYPSVIAILSAIGLLRAINKPLFSFLRSLVAATATKRDDDLLTGVEQSKAYKGLCWTLDYLTSIRLQPVKVVQVESEEK